MSVYLLVKVRDEWAAHTERRVRDELIGIEEVVWLHAAPEEKTEEVNE